MTDSLTPIPTPADLPIWLEDIGVVLDDGDDVQLGRFLTLLFDANSRFNLTRITDPEDAWRRHVFDALTLMPILAAVEATSVIDIGSGGGVPGIPLAIARPDVAMTLLEATGKKARFLEEASETLGLTNTNVLNVRAEDAGAAPPHRGAYDAVIARAVGPLPVLLELTVPFARVGGTVIAIKGAQAESEVEASASALRRLKAEVTDTVQTPTGTIVLIEKNAPTPRPFPRRPGEPKRAPL